MNLSRNYVLVLDQQSDDLRILSSSLEKLCCPMVIASSAEQVMARAIQAPPALVILSGDSQQWLAVLSNGLRNIADASGAMIVALTDCNDPSWLRQEENPGLDGFLVKPLTVDVLTSVVQSAWVRRACCATK